MRARRSIEGSLESVYVPPNDTAPNPNCPSCRELRKQVEALTELLAEQGRVNAGLQARLDASEQEAHRQAAPFRRPEKKRKDEKEKPGRKKGHPPAYRQAPPTVDETVEVPLECCPHCSGPVENVRAIHQIIEDIPPIVIRRLRLTTYRGHCSRCGCVHSTHPEQVSTATGAARTHLGRNALALAADLNKHFGITMRKTCAILEEHFGLRITPGGLSQALDRIADKLYPTYEQIVSSLRQSPAVHADETGWWLGGKSAWLWVFTTPKLTAYVIGNRSQQVIRNILSDEYDGVLTSDCLSSYDPHPGRKSKCVAHHLKAISEGLERMLDSPYLKDLRSFFHVAIFWHGLRGELDPAQYWSGVTHLDRRIDVLLAMPHSHPEEIRIANRLRKHRPHLLTFLFVEGVDPTNNLAERQLRPAVIIRKLSAGNKTDRGKRTLQVLTSLAATCRQQGQSFAETVAARLSLGLPPPASLFAPD